jgi:hypothetical protein
MSMIWSVDEWNQSIFGEMNSKKVRASTCWRKPMIVISFLMCPILNGALYRGQELLIRAPVEGPHDFFPQLRLQLPGSSSCVWAQGPGDWGEKLGPSGSRRPAHVIALLPVMNQHKPYNRSAIHLEKRTKVAFSFFSPPVGSHPRKKVDITVNPTRWQLGFSTDGSRQKIY